MCCELNTVNVLHVTYLKVETDVIGCRLTVGDIWVKLKAD